MKAAIFCGDRNWMDAEKIGAEIDRRKPDVIIEGEAPGADRTARREATARGYAFGAPPAITLPAVEPYPAEWEKYRNIRPGKGNPAGPIRNGVMLKRLLEFQELGWEVEVVAFHSDIDNSKGTKDMKKQAEKKNVKVEVIK